MSRFPALWPSATAHLKTTTPDHPVLYFRPDRLQATARRFLAGFPGLVTYAVKANDQPCVLENLVAAGMRAFDVASTHEMDLVRRVLPGATLHYNNPVRSRAEIAHAVSLGVASYSVDGFGGLEKLAKQVPPGIEIAVRMKLPVKGAAYDFGAKFGADPDLCADLLRRVVALGYRPAMTFHPGTQCEDPSAWTAYIAAAADVARGAGVTIERLNVGGGFPSHRTGDAPELERFFDEIARSVTAHFGSRAPRLVCEPGRAMVADGFTLATRVKAIRDHDGAVYLNDGVYGGFQEAGFLGPVARVTVVSPEGQRRTGPQSPRIVFGPTCDSLDRLAGTLDLPESLLDEDFILFDGMGAYSSATNTRFNGYGAFEVVTVGSERG